jgi:P27 family predicted phage terminase small subunit
MASPGPRPKPARLRLLAGNAGHRKPKNNPKPTPIATACPSWLSPAAKRQWRELAPELERNGLLTSLDGPAFAVTLVTYDLARRAWAELERDGLTREDRAHGGMKTKHPAASIFGAMSNAFRMWCAEFGLTPSARARFDMPSPDGELSDLD